MKRPALLVALALLGACRTTGANEYPSLAIRDAERVTGTLQAPAPYVPQPLAPTVTGDLSRLSADVAAASRAFDQAAPAARRSVDAARGSGTGSDAWAAAQVALAGLESARSQAMIALAELDRLYVAAATEGTELAPIEIARASATATIDSQTATIAALLAGLG